MVAFGSRVALASLRNQVVLPALRIVRVNIERAQGTSDGACRTWRVALVVVKLVRKDNLLALRMILVFASMLALIEKMLLDVLDLDDLLALPARREHGAILPVVHVKRLFVPVGVGLAAEAACVLRSGLRFTVGAAAGSSGVTILVAVVIVACPR